MRFAAPAAAAAWVSLALMLGGCAAQSARPALERAEAPIKTVSGTIQEVRPSGYGDPNTLQDDGVGALFGGYTGAIIGTAFGQGTGRAAGAAIGFLAGMFAGAVIENASEGPARTEYLIALEDGGVVAILVPKSPEYLPGTRVAVRVFRDGYAEIQPLLA